MNINQILNKPFTFTRRSQLIPGDLRPAWKSALILIIFGVIGKNNKCSLKKLHIANWISKSGDHVEEFLYWAGDTKSVRPDIRMEPALDRAIELMVGTKLLIKSKGKLEITDLGLEMFEKLNKLSVLETEKNRLLAVKKFITETNVERVFKVA
ncbi:hypothetical protein [Shewanella xiamenensis]|uniref:hypothetical protein n=1 Tax=Shewanella xiamenensis TaxID=332186 RepID=UPI0024A74841|nr:hypothetical protein [Shewanella xiamenensis]MDI5838359.1 hypothetical protein [Shewanella xiamenensis]MDI5842301.1 hypothetical protein [Shewanella xiamenensis]MDI5846254.1 hypothetical protein [Shewanella xiamenensis]MDI5850210.1 hypothetical protein [Shewanella xiamenensis]MDI5854159.1 hypothetical protein [Shewanella xiamenensis]